MERIARARRPSTLKVYEGKWGVFRKWCKSQDLQPLALSPPQLASFFLWLFEDKGLAPITIKGYRSMLSDTYRHHGLFDVGRDKDLSDLMANFERSRPRSTVLFPRWNLAIVLRWLNSAEFEPLEQCSIKNLTLKTCFLIALASASRVSELHALSADPAYLQHRDDGSIRLLTEPGFIAKNRLPSVGVQAVVIHPLPVAQDSVESLQDPVRALSLYLKRTKARRQRSSRLFQHWLESKPDIAPQTISKWLRSVIKMAYRAESTPLQGADAPRAHEIRAIASSLAFDRNLATKEIIQAVGWRSQSTFGRFYLRDLNAQREALNNLGPVAVAQLVSRPIP